MLQLLKHLYREESDPEALQALLEDPELQQEFGQLEEMRDVLASGMGRAQPRAPEPAVNRIIEAATTEPGPIYMGPIRRSRRRRIMLLTSVITGAAAVVALLILTFQPRNEIPEAESLTEQQEQTAPDTTLTWDDTDDFIQIRQSFSVVRQRTSPQLWDESAVMTLDSIPNNPAGSIPGLHSVSTNPR